MSFGLCLSMVMVGGIALGVASDLEWRTGPAVAMAACALAVPFGGHRRRWRATCGWVAVAALAFAYGSHARAIALESLPAWISEARDPLVITGWLTRDAALGDSGVRLEIGNLEIIGHDGQPLVRRNRDVLVIVSGDAAPAFVEQWTAGRRVRMPARLRTPSVVRNPGSPGVRWQRLTRPFDLIGAVKSASLVDVEPGPLWAEAAASVRRYVRRVCAQWLVPHGARSAAVVTAILIGDRAGLGEELTRRLQAAGTFHVMAISGGNVAILTTMWFVALRVLMGRERLPTLMTLVMVVTYGVVVGVDPSVVRAVVAACLYLGLRLTGLVPRAINVLALTALLCLVADPLMVVDVGAWLSFGATLGLIIILPRLILMMREPGRRGAVRQALHLAQGLFLATVAAEIVMLPVAAAVFMRIGIAGLPLNFIAIPAMTIAQVAGLGLCVLAPWWPGGAALAAGIAHWATWILTSSAGLVEIAPWLSWRVPPAPVGLVAVYYAALVTALVWAGRRIIRRGAVAVAVLCACAMTSAPWTLWRLPPAGWLRVTMMDVGQGESIALQFPDGPVLLVDAGGSTGAYDVGGRVVTPALWASGVRRLNWLAVTHGDVDHAGGAVRVMDDLRPEEIWEGVPVPLHPPLADVRRAAAGMTWRRLFTGQQIETGGALIDVLHPPVPDWERRRVRNDDSLVLRVRFGLVELLLTGDAGPEFEAAFTRDERTPPIRVLKVGHHGSRTSTSDRFLDAYAPTVALVSVGRANLFGHPAPDVLQRLGQRGIDVFRTDRDGAIVIETDGRQARVRTATGRVLVVTAQS